MWQQQQKQFNIWKTIFLTTEFANISVQSCNEATIMKWTIDLRTSKFSAVNSTYM